MSVDAARLNSYGYATPTVAPPAPAALPPVREAEAPAKTERAAREPQQASSGVQGYDLRFRVDGNSGEVVVTVVDPDSGSVLRQIPSEEALHLAKVMESFGRKFLDDVA